MSVKKIRLELARTKGFPEGSSHHGYEFVAPLTADGHLDEAAWKAHKAECTVRRFWADEDDEHGHLVHVRGRWLFDYDGTSDEEDEPIFKLDRHTLVEGEYITITEHDGEMLPFKVVKVK